MAQNFDTKTYYRKLANNEALTEDEVVALLKAVDTYQAATAYLASCQAATLESLPKSASKSSRSRHVAICKMAAGFLDGYPNSAPYPTRPDHAQSRCNDAIAESDNLNK